MRQPDYIYNTYATEYLKEPDPATLCRKMESDANFRPECTDEQLMGLVRDENGRPRHTPSRSAWMIKSKREIPTLGFFYIISRASYGQFSSYEYESAPCWNIDRRIILIRYNCSTCVYDGQSLDDLIVNLRSPAPIAPLETNLNRYLGCPCLHGGGPKAIER